MNKSWLILIVAGLFEIGWVVGLKHSFNGITWTLTAAAIYISMHLLVLASKKLPTGTAYAVFTGIGTAGTVLMEITVFQQPASLIKIVLIVVLLSGVMGLKLTTGENDRGQSV